MKPFFWILVLSLTLASVAIPQTLVDATFGDAPPEPVRGFQARGGDWRVEDGVVSVGPGAGPKLVLKETIPEESTVGVEVLLRDDSDGNVGLIVKVNRAGVGADAFDGYEVSLYARGQLLRLGRHQQNFELLRDVPCTVPVGEWIPLVVHLRGTALLIDVNGKRVLEHDDGARALPAGAVGFRPWQREASYRGLWIQAGDPRRTIPLEPPSNDDRESVFPGWEPVRRGSARGACARDTASPAHTRGSQRLTLIEGEGEIGIRTVGSEPAAIPLEGGRPYGGRLWIRSDRAATVAMSLEDADGTPLAVSRASLEPGTWRSLGFRLVPRHDTDRGRLTIALGSAATLWIARAHLEPGDWGWSDTLACEDIAPIAFVMRHPLGAPPAVGQDLWAALPRSPGCGIQVIDPSRPEEPPRTVFEDPDGSIYDMNVSDDARTLFFSYRGKGEEHWNLWRIGADGSGLTRLTDGLYHDVSACELPGGDLIFVSTRRFGYTLCQPGPASNLHRMDRDGGSIRCVSMNTLSDMSPQMLPDGRVLFTRWEYIDRDLTFRQSLWTQLPDGSDYQLYFGNTVRDVGTFWQARPIPGRNDRLISTFAPHHGFPHGAIGIIDRRSGVEGPKGEGFTYITRELSSIGDARQEWAYRDPFPVDEQRILCSYGGGGVERYRLVLLDMENRRRLVYEDPERSCYFPLPLCPRVRPPRIPDRVRPPVAAPASTEDTTTGTFVLVDVYRGLEPAIGRGRALRIRVLEQIRKTEDLLSRAFDQSPVMSYGTYYAKRSWGTVPIEEDGSAYFRAPALREIYLQVLDAEGRELQRMTSGVQLMPGESVSCIGCHESRDSSPPAIGSVPLALRRPPQDLEPELAKNDGIIDFPSLVQPVLDKHCVECHGGGDPAGGYDLTGDKTRYFSMAYDHLLGRSRSYRQHDMATGEMLEPERAKGKPLVHFYWLLRTPTGVNQPLWAGSHASRLTELIESDHAGHAIPLEDRRKIYLWIDANVPYYATYAHSRPHSPGRRDLWTDPETGQLSTWFARDFLGVFDRACAGCHGKLEGTTDWEGRYAWINITRPEYSPALTAHLARDAGGRGIPVQRDGGESVLFESPKDADYRAMLRTIEAGKRQVLETPEADMPGFAGARPEP